MADSKAELDQDIQAQNAVLQTVVQNLQTVVANQLKVSSDIEAILAKLANAGQDLSTEKEAIESQTSTLTTVRDTLKDVADALAASDAKANS